MAVAGPVLPPLSVFTQPQLDTIVGQGRRLGKGRDENGKLVANVDVFDQNRALVDGPCSGVGRKDLNFKALHLTQFTINIGPSARSGTVKKAWEKEEITKKWERAELTDFERFKLRKAKQTRDRLTNIEYGRL
ncbi:large ribosomal subunit protein eL14-like [Physella acuta]|uniref:large ribosomal subunit protein eL14-like n=1 Tax=Physella acuta TaxID=109671 RepID=UPI0027DBDDEF|nr:large ribosomal subunit protein eL14-like [Physella acuta]